MAAARPVARMSPHPNKPTERRLQNRGGTSLGWRGSLFWLLLLAVTLLALAPKPPPTADLGWDKLNHLAAFVALGLLARLAWPAQALSRWALALLGYGGLLEIAQGLTPNRHGEWADLLADAAGLLVALALGECWQRWQQTRDARPQAD